MNPHADIRDAIDRVVKYASRKDSPWLEIRETRTREALESLYVRFGIDNEALQEHLEYLGVLHAFTSLSVEDALCTRLPDGSRSLIDEYLGRRGFQETPRARRYLQALRASAVQLYEIVAVEQGEWVELRDVAKDGAVQRVRVPIWSDEMVPHHRVAVRVVTFDDGPVFSNTVLQLDEAQGERLERFLARARTATDDERARLAAESAIDAAVLTRIAAGASDSIGTAVLQFWLNTLLEGTLGHAIDADLDEHDLDAGRDLRDVMSIEFYTATMTIDPAAVPVIAERLDALPAWQRPLPGVERWTRVRSSDPEPVLQGLEESPWDVSLEADQLYVEAESRDAMERIIADIQAALGGLVGEPYIMCEEIEEPRDAASALRAVRHETYSCLLDEPQPGFGHRTPREHATSGEGRRAVADWLRTLEEMEIRQAGANGLEPYDLLWMWCELGLESERRNAVH